MTERPPLSPSFLATTNEFRQRARWAWRVFWRGKYMVLACMVLVMVPAILFLQQETPRYTAEARLLIEAPDTNDVLSDRTANRQRLSEVVIQTEADLITSSMLARRVIDKLHLDEDPEFNGSLQTPKPIATLLAYLNPLSWIPPSWTTKADESTPLQPSARAEIAKSRIVRAFSSRLTARPQRRSYIISLQFASESREKAARIVNTVAEVYMVDRLEASFEEARRITGWLGERLESLQHDVVAAETASEEFRAQNGLRRKNERQATISDQQLSELNSRLVIARTELAQKQARSDQIRTLLRSRGNLETATDVLQSPLIQRLREQETIKSREMSDALKVYGERHPRMLGFRADLNDLRGKIAGEIEKVAASISNDVEVAAAGLQSLERQVAALRRQADTAGEADVRLQELERQAAASRGLYEAFLTRFKREAEQERMQRTNARIVATADIPVSSSYPATRSILAMSMLMAALFGIGAVFVLDRLDNAIRSADEAEELTGLPTLAMVPLQRRGAARPIEEMLQRPRSPLADGVRSLRTALDLGGEQRPRVVLTTSSVPKEGKTFVSLCLALMFSKQDERVLLIDGDVHRPRLHSAIGVEGERGFAQLISGEATFDELVLRSVSGTALDFLPAGRASDLAELIKGPRVEALIAELSKSYDRIVIDSPPVLAVADARVLARLADRVIYLVKWNATPRDAVHNGIKLLRGVGVNVCGLVLSQVNQRKHGRYGYGDYGHYYGRYREYYGE